jgi:hypothetical protein
MAIDNTPPRLRLIGTIAFIVIITLLGLNFVFESYFAYMSDEARREKLAPRTELLAQVAAEHAAMQGAKMQLDQAVAQLKSGKREALVEPKPSDDVGAMTGWSKLPKQAPLPAPGAHGPDTHGADTHPPDVNLAADAGAATAADGGAPAADGGALATDAGAAPKGGAAAKDAGARAPH